MRHPPDAEVITRGPRRPDTHDYRLHDVRGKELRDLTVGVVGTGRIGSAVLDRLRGFGCRSLAYDTCRTTAARYVPLGELLAQSDIVTLHTPLTAETHHLLDRRRIGQMKHGAFIGIYWRSVDRVGSLAVPRGWPARGSPRSRNRC